MAVVWIPSLLRDLTGGISEIEVFGGTVGEIIDQLENSYPGIRDRLRDGDQIRPTISVVVDGARAAGGLRERVDPASEVHFVPAIAGGLAYPMAEPLHSGER